MVTKGKGMAREDMAEETLTGDRIISLHAGYEVDGVYTDAFLARPVDGQPRAAVVLLSGMFGLSWTQREITRLYARQGFVALSPDYVPPGTPGQIAKALLTKNLLDVEGTVKRALIGGANFLRALPWVAPQAGIGIMGFCLGGGLALLAAARSDVFKAGVIYHQSLFPDPRELANINCKLQCHYGTDDHSTPKTEIDAFTKTMDHFGKSYEVHMYEGMKHSFAQFAPDAELPPAQRAATNLSFSRSFEFFHRELDAPAKYSPSVEKAPEPTPQEN
jgi:carboxymethylenebutenolidase